MTRDKNHTARAPALLFIAEGEDRTNEKLNTESMGNNSTIDYKAQNEVFKASSDVIENT